MHGEAEQTMYVNKCQAYTIDGMSPIVNKYVNCVGMALMLFSVGYIDIV